MEVMAMGLMQASMVAGVFLGLGYAYGGLLVLMGVDSLYEPVAEWVNERHWAGIAALVFWPAAVFVVLWRQALRQRRPQRFC
jgi:hypothetical protein